MHLASPGQVPLIYIEQQEQLDGALPLMAQSAALSFDLEFDNNLYSYGVTLCLVQVATADSCYVIDPIAGLDLSGLYALFADSRIQKVVHSSGEDLRLLHSLGCYPKNLFDTEIVARLLNYEKPSLSVLLLEKLQQELDKKHQKSNWLRRPLSEAQLQYAAADVLWLQPLRDVLLAEAGNQGLLPFVVAEQDYLGQVVHKQLPKEHFLKPADLSSLSPREQYVANELLRHRDELARQVNKPAYQVLGEILVRELATGARAPEMIIYDSSVYPRFRNSGFARQLSQRLRTLKDEAAARGLSAELQGRTRLTAAQHEAHRKAAYDREHKFAPVQEALAKRYGTFAAQFILSKRIVNELLSGALAFRELGSGYRQDMIRETAVSLGIDIREYTE